MCEFKLCFSENCLLSVEKQKVEKDFTGPLMLCPDCGGVVHKSRALIDDEGIVVVTYACCDCMWNNTEYND